MHACGTQLLKFHIGHDYSRFIYFFDVKRDFFMKVMSSGKYGGGHTSLI